MPGLFYFIDEQYQSYYIYKIQVVQEKKLQNKTKKDSMNYLRLESDYMLKAINIKWDTDGDMEVLNELPMEMIIPDKLEEMYKKDKEYALDEISDW